MQRTQQKAARKRKRLATSNLRQAFQRAGDGIRTRDIQLGKLVLYQLSYTRKGADQDGCHVDLVMLAAMRCGVKLVLV